MSEREIFLALLDLPNSDACNRYLQEVCKGDAVARARIEALLQSHFQADNFLDQPAVAKLDLDAIASQCGCEELFIDNNSKNLDLSFLAAPMRQDSLGRLGHYEILDLLGQGAFGIVFRAFDETLQRVVAVKVLMPQIATNSPARKRFLREARLLARVRHENVIQVYAVEELPLPYLVMEYIPGETLQQRIDQMGPLAPLEAVQIAYQIAEGLAAAHEVSLIHRDIKPANILIEKSTLRIKITDFGLARTIDDVSLSQSGIVAGTPLYMSPEQAKGETVDFRSDLFSLGSVLYTICSGRPPFRANGTLAVLKRVSEDTPRMIQEITPGVPTWLCDMISRMHAKEPEQRFASAREIADLLAQALSRPYELTEVTFAGNKVPPDRKARSWATWMSAGGLLLVLLTSLGLTEATGISQMQNNVIDLLTANGTLVVELDDPSAHVVINDEDANISGVGVREVRLPPGKHIVKAIKDGNIISQDLITITRNCRQVVRVSCVPTQTTTTADMDHLYPPARSNPPQKDASLWEKRVAGLSAEAQVTDVISRLKKLNADFSGTVIPTIDKGVVTGLRFSTDGVYDITPLRGLPHLKSLTCTSERGNGMLSDLSPLKGLQLESLDITGNPVSDLTPLKSMPLKQLVCRVSRVADLSPVKDMPLSWLECGCSRVRDLSPLRGMRLTKLVIDHAPVIDLSPIKGMPLTFLHFSGSRGISDLSPIKGMPLTHLFFTGTSVANIEPIRGLQLKEIAFDFKLQRDEEILRTITTLNFINYKPSMKFWEELRP